jgi:hypothetical protein
MPAPVGPPASSLPDHDTGKLAVADANGSAVTLLVGGPSSRVVIQMLVSIGSLVSKMILAWASMRVPVG